MERKRDEVKVWVAESITLTEILCADVNKKKRIFLILEQKFLLPIF